VKQEALLRPDKSGLRRAKPGRELEIYFPHVYNHNVLHFQMLRYLILLSQFNIYV